MRKFWPDSHISEDFDISLRMQMNKFIVRLATYHHGGFKEGVSLTVYDELARWEKYAFLHLQFLLILAILTQLGMHMAATNSSSNLFACGTKAHLLVCLCVSYGVTLKSRAKLRSWHTVSCQGIKPLLFPSVLG